MMPLSSRRPSMIDPGTVERRIRPPRRAPAMRALLTAAALALGTARPGLAADSAQGLLHGGDRWCAIGDSITHGGLWHGYVYLFHATRFPGQRFEMANCGISGDVAGGGLNRLSWDIMPHQPTVASLAFGMNDVGRYLYESGQDGAQAIQQRERALNEYTLKMRKLADELKSNGVRLIFMTPSPFDQTAVLDKPYEKGAVGVNDGLTKVAARVRELAAEFHAPVVDLHGPMTRLTLARQQADPHFTLLRTDRVHPVDTGHFVMAWLFLKAEGVPGAVSDIALDAASGRVLRAGNAKVSGVVAQGGSVEFTVEEAALPFPLAEREQAALKLVPFMQELNRETLQVSGLGAGPHKVSIDDTAIGTFSAEDLAAGIDLAAHSDTPQYRQALEAMKINDERHRLAATKLRAIAYIDFKLGYKGGSPDLGAQARIEQAAKLAAEAKPGDWMKSQYTEYVASKPHEAELKRQLADLTDRLWAAVQPRAHRYAVRPAGTGGAR